MEEVPSGQKKLQAGSEGTRWPRGPLPSGSCPQAGDTARLGSSTGWEGCGGKLKGSSCNDRGPGLKQERPSDPQHGGGETGGTTVGGEKGTLSSSSASHGKLRLEGSGPVPGAPSLCPAGLMGPGWPLSTHPSGQGSQWPWAARLLWVPAGQGLGVAVPGGQKCPERREDQMGQGHRTLSCLAL